MLIILILFTSKLYYNYLTLSVDSFYTFLDVLCRVLGGWLDGIHNGLIEVRGKYCRKVVILVFFIRAVVFHRVRIYEVSCSVYISSLSGPDS